jgi:hypothetical protein
MALYPWPSKGMMPALVGPLDEGTLYRECIHQRRLFDDVCSRFPRRDASLTKIRRWKTSNISVSLVFVCSSVTATRVHSHAECSKKRASKNFWSDYINIVTCYLRSQPIQRFIARQQLGKHATVLEPLLGSSPRATMEVELGAVFSMWSDPRLYHSIDR